MTAFFRVLFLGMFIFGGAAFAENAADRICVSATPDPAAIRKMADPKHRLHIVLTDSRPSPEASDIPGIRLHPIAMSPSEPDDFKMAQILSLARDGQGRVMICAKSPDGVPTLCLLTYKMLFEGLAKNQAVRMIPPGAPDAAAMRAYIEKCDIGDLRDRILEKGRHTRPEKWAGKVREPEFDNLYKVSDKLYRGEQPQRDGFKRLEEMGVGGTISLRQHNLDPEIAKGINLSFRHCNISLELKPDGSCPDIDREVTRALKIINSSEKPVFIHCLHGSDRTGLTAAAYRVVIQNWTKEEAAKEMVYGGFEFHYFPYLDYLKQMDAEKIRADVFQK